MTLPRETVSAGLVEELDRFADLVRSLDESEWRTPSRCEGWTAGDLAAHVAGTLTDVAAGNLEGQGSPEVTQRQVDERRGRSASELADEIEGGRKVAADMLAGFDDAAWAGPMPPLPGTLGWGVESLWYDAYLHADDIRAAVGRPSERGPGLDAAVSHVAAVLDDQGWGPATLALDGVGNGLDAVEIGGGGRKVTGDAFDFVQVATGRADPAQFGLDASVNIYR